MAEKSFSDYLVGIDDDSLLVLVSDDFMYFYDCIKLTESLLNDFDRAGVVILLNKHVDAFLDVIKKDKISHKNLWFIDAVSLVSGLGQPAVKNCITVSHPTNYEEVMLAVTEALSNLEKKKRKFVVLVSPHVLLDLLDMDGVGLFLCQYRDFLKAKDTFSIIALEKEGQSRFEEMINNLADYVIRT